MNEKGPLGGGEVGECVNKKLHQCSFHTVFVAWWHTACFLACLTRMVSVGHPCTYAHTHAHDVMWERRECNGLMMCYCDGCIIVERKEGSVSFFFSISLLASLPRCFISFLFCFFSFYQHDHLFSSLLPRLNELEGISKGNGSIAPSSQAALFFGLGQL